MRNVPYSKRVLIAGLALAVAYILYAIIAEWRGLSHMRFMGYDYAFFYYAFRAVLENHATWSNLYNDHAQQIFLHTYGFPFNPNNQFVYPPQFAFLLSFLGSIPFYLSAFLWMVMSTLLYFSGIYWIAKLLWPRMRRTYLLIIFVIASTMTPFEVDLGVGNVNSMLFALIALSFYCLYKRKKPGLASIPLSLAVLFKVTPIAVLFVFVLRKEWRFCIWTIFFVTLGTVITACFIGVSPILQYIVHFVSFGHTSMKNGPAPYNQSIYGILGMFRQHNWWPLPIWTESLIYLGFLATSLMLIRRAVRRTTPDAWRTDMALASLTPLLLSPLIEQAHLLFAFPAIMVFIRLVHESMTKNDPSSFKTAIILSFVTVINLLLLSLPATFALNFFVDHWPHLFWLHTQMFYVLTMTFITTVWLYRRHIGSPQSTDRIN